MKSPAASRIGARVASGISIAYRQIDELKPDPANPRLHSKKQIRQIANSIEVFGFIVPILIDRDGTVIAGHGRLLACREPGITEVPTLCLDHLTPARARAFMIADNRLAEIASWDDRLLAQQLKDLSLLGLDFSLEVIGFEMGEIDLRIASLEDMRELANDPADAAPEVSAGPSLSKSEDLWLLGRHRVLCGNALDPAAFAALMGEEHATTVFTDPPYNVPIDGHASGLGAIHHRPFPMASGEMDKAGFTVFLSAKLAGTSPHSAPTDPSTTSAWTGATWTRCWPPAAKRMASLKTSASGPRTMAGWARSTAASTNSSLSSNRGAGRTATTCSLVSSAVTAAMCGAIPGSTPLPAAARRAICWRSTRP
jgi:ParB-like nuclease domain